MGDFPRYVLKGLGTTHSTYQCLNAKTTSHSRPEISMNLWSVVYFSLNSHAYRYDVCKHPPLFALVTYYQSLQNQGYLTILHESNPPIYPLTQPLEGSRELASHTNLTPKEVHKVNQGTKTEGYESDSRYCPFCGHVLEHEDTEMGETGCHEEGWDEECCDCRCCDIGVGI